MTVSDTLNLAADLIEERGWTRGEGWLNQSGPLCLEGGIAAAAGFDLRHPDYPEKLGPAYSTLLACPAFKAVDAYLNVGALFVWNDSRERTAAEVVEVLRATALIEAARERETAEVTR